MAGQFDKIGNNTIYWMLTPNSTLYVSRVHSGGYSSNFSSPTYSVGSRPAMNLKQNVVITGGKGTKEEPFTIKLGS